MVGGILFYEFTSREVFLRKEAFSRYSTSMRSHMREVLRLGWGGAKSNLLPGMVLWGVGSVLVALYHQVETVAQALDIVGEFKLRYSPWFAMLSTALFGSLIPWMVQLFFLGEEDRQPAWQVPLLFLFWCLQGWEVDWLYRIQAMIFGSGIDLVTIAQKTMVDQFVWVPFLGVPQVVLGYLFIENKCSLASCRKALERKSFLARTIPLVIATWIVWIPAVSLIYLFPLALQLPLMNLILAMWCLILTFFAKNS